MNFNGIMLSSFKFKVIHIGHSFIKFNILIFIKLHKELFIRVIHLMLTNFLLTKQNLSPSNTKVRQNKLVSIHRVSMNIRRRYTLKEG